MKRQSYWLRSYVGLTAILLALPTVLLIPMSLSARTTFSLPTDGLSLRWYDSLLTSSSWRDAAVNSFKVSFVVAPVATVLGTLAAFGIWRTRGPVQGLLLGYARAPLVIPTLVTAMGLYSYLLTQGLSGTLRGIMLGQVVLSLPFVVIAVMTRLTGYDSRLTQAARGLGASPLAAFRQITFPLVLPGILTGLVLAFAFSFDELIVALLLQSPEATTLPVKMYNAIAEEADPTISAASSVVTLAITIPIIAVQIHVARRQQKAKKQ